MYKKHFDWQELIWHVFYEHDGQQDYVISYSHKEDAQNFCDRENKRLLEVKS